LAQGIERVNGRREQDSPYPGTGMQKGLTGKIRGGKNQISETKNPGLSTRVFAIDSKQPVASS
jgi:hypothetical protein